MFHRPPPRYTPRVVLVTALFAVPGFARAQPACVSGTVTDYAGLGSTGCAIGDVTFRYLDDIPDRSAISTARLTPFSLPLVGGARLVGFDFAFATPNVLTQTVPAGAPGTTDGDSPLVAFLASATNGSSITGVRLLGYTISAASATAALGADARVAATVGSATSTDIHQVSAHVSSPPPCVFSFCPGNVDAVDFAPISVGSFYLGNGVELLATGQLDTAPGTAYARVDGFQAALVVGPAVVPEPSSRALVMLAVMSGGVLIRWRARRR